MKYKEKLTKPIVFLGEADISVKTKNTKRELKFNTSQFILQE